MDKFDGTRSDVSLAGFIYWAGDNMIWLKCWDKTGDRCHGVTVSYCDTAGPYYDTPIFLNASRHIVQLDWRAHIWELDSDPHS